MWAFGEFGCGLDGFHVHIDNDIGRRPDFSRTRRDTLHVSQRTMALDNVFFIKPRTLEVSVYVACEHKAAGWFLLSPLQQDPETRMRFGRTIQIDPMPKESPGLRGIASEPDWV